MKKTLDDAYIDALKARAERAEAEAALMPALRQRNAVLEQERDDLEREVRALRAELEQLYGGPVLPDAGQEPRP